LTPAKNNLLTAGDKLISGVVDTGDKLIYGVVDTGDKLIAGVVDAGDKSPEPLSVCLHLDIIVLEKIIEYYILNPIASKQNMKIITVKNISYYRRCR
jgi:hypothetical protein